MSEDRVVEGLPVQAFRVEALPDGTWEWLCLASAGCSVSGFGGIADAASAAGRHVAEVHGGLVPAVTTLVATRATGLPGTYDDDSEGGPDDEDQGGDPDLLDLTTDTPTTDPCGLTSDLGALQRLPLAPAAPVILGPPEFGYFGERAPELLAAGSAAAAAVVDGGREPGRRLPPAVDELVRVTVEGRARAVVPGGGFKVVVADGPASGMSLARITEVGSQRAWIESMAAPVDPQGPLHPSSGRPMRRWVSLTDQLDYPNYPPGPDSRELGEQLVDLMGAEVEAYREAADRCRVGDADPTPELGAPVCGFEWPVGDWSGVTWSCTRSARHGVQHVAAAGGVVVSVCPMPAGLAERLAPGGAL
jgi:hypothetical protein